jgi:MFS family permease
MPRSLWLLVIGMMINVTGASFLWPLNTIYIHEHLGKSLSVAGFVLMLNSAASVIGNLVGGSLFDKIGGYKTVLFGIVITLFSVIGLALNHDWPFYVFLLTSVGLGAGIVFPAMYAMAGVVWPEGGRKAFNALYVAQNLGVAVGAMLGGLVASYSMDYIFASNAIIYMLFVVLAAFGYRGITTRGNSSKIFNERKHVKSQTNLSALLLLCASFLLTWITYVQWTSTISTYTQQLGISLNLYSLLWTINGALIVIGQPAMAALVRFVLKTPKLQIISGIAIFILSFIVVANAKNFTGFLVAMIILTIGEMLVWPAVPTAANELAPKGREGFYQGVVNSAATGGRMIGPLLGGVCADLFGMDKLFFALIGLLILSITTTILYDRKLKEKSNVQTAMKVS